MSAFTYSLLDFGVGFDIDLGLAPGPSAFFLRLSAVFF